MTETNPSNNKNSSENPFEGWVTMKEAGEIVNRSHGTIRYWVENGKITSYPIGSGGVRVVNVEEVKAYSDNTYRLDRPKKGKSGKSD